tara:strand:- start:89 stop:580 length:492 start_codon:yes stop_codon:yes gene_type:complete
MQKIFVISDLHFSHLNMALRRGFDNIEDHDNHIVEKWNSVVNSKDTVWILGDITMEKSEPYHLIDKLMGFKNVILGNHDRPQHISKLLNHVNKVCSSWTKSGNILTHIPIHTRELESRYRKNIHGHLHEHNIKDESLDVFDNRYFNVSCEQLDYTPIELNTIN